MELIAKYQPKYWFVENPAHVKGMEAEAMMKDLPSYVTDYCRWGFPYMKTTRVWTNLPLAELPRCNHDKTHPHEVTLGGCYGGQGGYTSKVQKGRVPPELCHHLLGEVEKQLERDAEAPFTRVQLFLTTADDPFELLLTRLLPVEGACANPDCSQVPCEGDLTCSAPCKSEVEKRGMGADGEPSRWGLPQIKVRFNEDLADVVDRVVVHGLQLVASGEPEVLDSRRTMTDRIALVALKVQALQCPQVGWAAPRLFLCANTSAT